MFGKNRKDKPKLLGLFLVTCFAVSLGVTLTLDPNPLDAAADESLSEYNAGGIASPQSNAIEEDNSYSGDGDPLTLYEWADSRNTTTGLSLIGAGTAGTSIRLAEGWDGYKIYTNVNNLYDTESWTRSYDVVFDGTADGNNNGDWTYGENQITNDVLGADDPGDYMWVDLNPRAGGLGTQWDANQRGWWDQSVPVPRGEVEAAWVAFDYWIGNYGGDPFCPWDMVKIYCEIEGQAVFDIPSGVIPDKTGAWNPTGLRPVPQSIIDYINTNTLTPGNVDLRVGILNSEGYSTNNYNGYTRFDNIRLFIKAKAQPTQLDLQLAFDGDGGNGGAQNAIQDVTYGDGELHYYATPSNWSAGATPLDINSTITTNATVDFPADGLEIVEFDIYQVIYGTNARDTTVGASLLASDGGNFEVSDGSDVNWTTFFYDRPPQIAGNQQDYTNYLFNGSKPSDWTIFSILDSQPEQKISYLIGADPPNTFVEMPTEYAEFYGFWSISANSPNYVQNLNVPVELYEGDDLNVNGTIISSTLTDSYVDQTSAELTIKYPNGTVWLTQTAGVDGSRQVQFTPIPIPISGSDYIAGDFTAILSWNNSRAGLPLNECGVAVETFTVRHRANLTAETALIEDVLNTEAALPVLLRYVDYGGNPVPDATITYTNFEGVTEQFDPKSGFYNYVTFLNCENGSNGYNYLDIEATSPAFEPKNVTVIVEIVRIANFTIDEFPSASAQWNDNITLRLTYIDGVNGSPIVISDPSNVTVDWDPGYYWVDMNESASGVYYVHLNTSQKIAGNSYLIPITIKEIGFQGKTILMDISVTPRLTALSVDPVPNLGYGELLVTNALYTETSSSNGITGATVTARIVQGNIPCTVVDIGGGDYNISVDTWLLPNLGNFTLQVNATWTGTPYYANQTSNTQFRAIQRSTQAYTSGTFDVQSWDTNFNISLFYIDVLNGTSVNGTDVSFTISAFDGATPLPAVAAGATIVYDTDIDAWQIEFFANDFGRTNIAPGFSVLIDVNWTANIAPYYVNKSLSFTIKIDETPTFLYIEDVSDLTAPSGQAHVVRFIYVNQISGAGIDGVGNNISITSSLLPNTTIFDPSSDINSIGGGTGAYDLTFNISDIAGNTGQFNISISVQNYQNINNYTFTLIKITEVPILEIINIDQVHLGQEMNITLYYHLQASSDGIPGATVRVSNNPLSDYWASGSDFVASYDSLSEYYNVTFTPSLAHAQVDSEGAYTVFVNFSSAEGETKLRVNFNVDPIPSNISSVFINTVDETGSLPSSTVYIGDLVNITLTYDDIFNTVAIADATVELTFGAYTYNLPWNATYSQYTVLLNTSIAPFTIGPFVFTATASKGNYTQDTQQIQLNILSVATNLTQYLDFVQVNTILVPYGQNLTVSVDYLKTVLNTSIVDPGVSISLTGGAQTITGARWALNGSYWEAAVNTTEVGAPGTYSMTITAGLTNYQTALAAFVLVIQQIPTELFAYDDSGSINNSYTIFWGETIDIAMIYNNTATGISISGANVQTSGAITNSSYSENIPWYNFTFDSSTFGLPNVYVITMSASKANHTSSSTQITVNVLPITTELRTYNTTAQTNSFSQVYGENVTVKVLLYDTVNGGAISVVNVLCSIPTALISPVGGEPGNYTVTLNTTYWTSDGIKQFTITGQSTNYVTDSEAITLNILSIPTDIAVFINGIDRTSTLQETIDYLDVFDVTVYFNDTFNLLPITGATLGLQFTNGSGTYSFPLAPVGGEPGNYTVTLDSSELGAANQYILSLNALKENYESFFAKINIFLNPIPTALNVTYNSVLLDPADTVNVIYTDIVVFNISLISYLEGNSPLNGSNTTVEIYTVLEGNRLDAIWNGTSSSYQLTINTGNPIYGLDAGFPHGISIYGEAVGYQSDNINLVIDVDLIPTVLSVKINQMNLTMAQAASYEFNQDVLFNVTFSRSYVFNQNLTSADVSLRFKNDITSAEVVVPLLPNFFVGTFEANLTIDSAVILAQSSKDFKIVANLSNYVTQQLTVYLDIVYIDTWMELEVNNQPYTNFINYDITLDSFLDFSVGFYDSATNSSLGGATVALNYYNRSAGLETVPFSYNGTSGLYQLDNFQFLLTKLLQTQNKAFTFSASLALHVNQTIELRMNIVLIELGVNISSSEGLKSNELIEIYPSEGFTFKVMVFEVDSNNIFLDYDDLNVSVRIGGSDLEEMEPEMVSGSFTGYYYITLDSPAELGEATIQVRISALNTSLEDKYILKRDHYVTLRVVERPVVDRPDLTPLVIGLFIGLIVLSVWFILYQVRFKYPPLIRKIHDMRGAVARGKSGERIKNPKVKNREENIYNHYAKVINVHSFLQTRDSKFAAKSSGYAPVPDDTISLEFEMASLDVGAAPVEVGPKTLKKKMATPSKPSTKPAAPPVTRPAAKPTTVTPPKPVTRVAAPPKPSVKKVARPVPSARPKPAVKPRRGAKPRPKPAGVKPLTISRPAMKKPAPAKGEAPSHESMYQKLVLLEQKRYKAERSLRDLNAKQSKGLLSEEEYKQYYDKINDSLEKIKTQITDIRRKLISF